jgi:hypothetical protein
VKFRHNGSLYIPDREIVGPDLRAFRVVPGPGRTGRGGMAGHVQPPPAAPDVTSISPTTGSDAGGEALTINGTGFVTGATVLVGGASATSVVVVGTTQITCVTPAGTAGARDVKVTNPDTQNDTLSAAYTYVAAGSFQTPDIFESSFEAGADGFSGLSGVVSREQAHAAAGTWAVRHTISPTGWAITSYTNATPTVLFVPGHGRTNGQQIGITGTGDSNLDCDYYGKSFNTVFRYAKVVDADHISVYSDASLTTAVGSSGGTGGTVTSGDAGSSFGRSWAVFNDGYAGAKNRCYGRFYFYIDTAITGPYKWQLWNDSSSYNRQQGGFYIMPANLAGGAIRVCWLFDDTDGNQSPQTTGLFTLASVLNSLNYLEVDFQYNGDTSNGGNDYPSAAFRLNGTAITASSGVTAYGASWINGRLNCGRRRPATGSNKLGAYNLFGVVNRGQTVGGNVWADKVAVSTLGWIGP